MIKFNFRTPVTIFLTLASLNIFACSCVESTLHEKISSSAVIFVAEVNKIETIEKSDPEMLDGGTRHGYFKVIETLKGSTKNVPYIESADSPICCICQAKLENNTNYVVFTNGDGPASYSLCGATTQLFDATAHYPETIKLLLQEHKPTEIYTGVYWATSRELFSDDGRRIKLHEVVLADQYNDMTRISVEALKLSSGDLLSVKVLKEQPLIRNETSLFYSQRVKEKD